MKASDYCKSNLQSIIKAGIFGLSLVFTAASFAESGVMSVAEQRNSSVQTPQNGQKMENVETQFGTPIERVGAVGEPPIIKWVYQEFTVYFENDIVLHSVLHRS